MKAKVFKEFGRRFARSPIVGIGKTNKVWEMIDSTQYVEFIHFDGVVSLLVVLELRD